MIGLRFSALGIVLLSVIYQWWLKELLFVTLGFGRVFQSIDNFPYKCRQLEHKQLEACGDMWLDDKHRILYAACAGAIARGEWDPNLSRFNYKGRRSQGSQLMAIYIDQPLKSGGFKMHPIQPTDYGVGPGDGKLDLAGFDVELLDDSSTHRFWLINQRPPYDENGVLLDARKHGHNTSIDVYEHRKGDPKMKFIARGWSPRLHSANKIAFVGDNNFVVTNERSSKVGLRKLFDRILGGGSLVFHDDWFDSYRVTPQTLSIPSAVVRGHDDRIYVPSQVDNQIRVFELQQYGIFKQVHAIKMETPIAGLTVDSKGTFWAVGRSRYDPTGRSSVNIIFKIEKIDKDWTRFVTHKILEDKESKVLNGASVVQHDVKTKRLFFGGSHMSFISVCEPR